MLYYPHSENKDAKLICVFVFAYAKSRFSHDEARMSLASKMTLNMLQHPTGHYAEKIEQGFRPGKDPIQRLAMEV